MPRKKAYSNLQSISRDWTDRAIATLGQIMMAPKAPHSARVAAANSLLNRGWGLPTVNVEHSSEQLEDIRKWFGWLASSHDLPMTIDGDAKPLLSLDNGGGDQQSTQLLGAPSDPQGGSENGTPGA